MVRDIPTSRMRGVHSAVHSGINPNLQNARKDQVTARSGILGDPSSGLD